MFGISWRSNRRASRQGHAAAVELCVELEDRIEAASRERMADMTEALLHLHDGWQTELECGFAFLGQATAVRAAMRRARSGSIIPARPDTPLQYQSSSLFLRDCSEYLTSDPAGRERLHLVTGTTTHGGVRVLSRIEKVTVEQQSAAYVKADPTLTHKQLVALTERDGHDLLAVFHSHIMHGPSCTQPSETDLATQRRFAAIGWDAIGGIFSLDGYVRFFSTSNDFDIDIYGNGAEIISATPRETIVKLQS